jgi:hypothetical protein
MGGKLTDDPTEIVNLVYAGQETAESIALRPRLEALLDEQRRLKCLSPRTNQGAARAGGEGLVPFDVPAGVAARRPEVQA